MDDFKNKFKGDLILPRDRSNDEVRQIYNAMIDKHPGIIAKCSNAEDVVQAVNFAWNEGLDLSIRSVGHNGAGLALVDDGFVIDLREIIFQKSKH